MVWQNFNGMAAKAVALPQISEPVSHMLTQVFNPVQIELLGYV
jgi:hypothetical protein